MREEFGLSILMTSTAMSFYNLAGILANPLGGATSDKVGERNVLLASFGLLGVIIMVFSGNISVLVAYVSVFLIGWLINFVRSPAFTIIPRVFGTEIAGSVSGIHNTFAAFGALAIPFTLGYVKDYTASYDIGWLIVSGLAFLSSFILFTLGNNHV
jgi:nitrate/nitrite transporter NarK